MTNDPADAAKHQAKRGARKFYKMSPDFGLNGAAGFEVQNLAVLLQGRRVLVPPPGRQGFPDYPEPPCVLINTKLGRPPLDLEEYHAYWLISDRAKSVFETVDPCGFTFVRCETRLVDGSPGPGYWLCDVVRVLDAVDEAASRMKIDYRYGVKMYDLMGRANLVFKEDVVGRSHVFRLAHLEPAVVCDQHLKDACEAAALNGLTFRDMSNY